MARELASYVHVYDDKGEAHAFGPGDEVPAWAAKQMGDHCFVSAGADGQTGEPPRSGKGSGKEAWAEFASHHGVEVTDEDTRDDIVARLADAGIVEG